MPTTRARSSPKAPQAGEVVDAPRGAGGFGYDPHFLLPRIGKTAAELSAAEKNRHQPSRAGAAGAGGPAPGGQPEGSRMIPIHPVSSSKPAVSAPVSPADNQQLWLKPGQIALPGSPPLSLYVHIPWCVRKCPYCDFNSHAAPGTVGGQDSHDIPEDAYLDALRADLEQSLPLVWGRPVHTVFIGGGTPSLLSAAGMDRLLSDIRALLPLDADAEITMEANPGTFEAERFASYRASGINRLSIGIQSFERPASRRRWAASTASARRARPSTSRRPASTTSTST